MVRSWYSECKRAVCWRGFRERNEGFREGRTWVWVEVGDVGVQVAGRV
jgi:hypothetical protein